MQFVLETPGKGLRATGARQHVVSGKRATLDERCQRALSAGASDAPAVLVGAIPFAADADEFIYQPEHAVASEARQLTTATSGAHKPSDAPSNALTARPSEIGYARMVERALVHIADRHGPRLDKVVLSRQMLLENASGLDFDRLLGVLADDPAVTAFRADLSETGNHLLIGATPEKLISRTGLAIESVPLAGSMPRGRSTSEDEERAAILLASEKDHREHAVTLEFVMDMLGPFCRELSTPDGTTLHRTASMWHLGTRVEGVLKSEDMPSAVGLAALLHPTPAVGGSPREAALSAIEELEEHDRGYYAGAVGWVDAKGDGEWYVALRCAELVAGQLILHAGAGIVEGSVPEQEVRETAAKFRAMLRAMGVEDTLWAAREAAE